MVLVKSSTSFWHLYPKQYCNTWILWFFCIFQWTAVVCFFHSRTFPLEDDSFEQWPKPWYVWDEMLPNYIGIKHSLPCNKDPYEPTRIQWNVSQGVCCRCPPIFCCVHCSIRLNHTNPVHRNRPIMSLLLGYSLGLLNQTALRILTPPMETLDPPNDTPGALQQVVWTPHDIPRMLRVFPFLRGFFLQGWFFWTEGFFVSPWSSTDGARQRSWVCL